MATIVDLHGKKFDPKIQYAGRPSKKWGTSPLGNPHEMMDESQRDEVVEKYRIWLWGKIKDKKGPQYDELKRLIELEKTQELILGCWCYPRKCHCEIIIRAMNWIRSH